MIERASGLFVPDRKPKVALTTVYPMGKIGGVQSELRDLAEDLPELGFEVTVHSPGNNLLRVGNGGSMSLGNVIPINVMGTSAYLGVLDFKNHKEVEEADVMHAHEPAIDAEQLFLLAKRRELERLRRRYSTTPVRRKANVGTFHAMNRDGSEYLMTFWPLVYVFDRRKILNRITVVSETLKRRFLKAFPFVQNSPIEVVPNGVDTRVFCPYPEGPKLAEFDDGMINVLSVSRLEERKGLIFVINAFALVARKHSNVRLIIGGFGPEMGNLQRRVRDLGIEKRVRFLGKVSQEDLPVLDRTAHIGIFLSTKNESFGIGPLEVESSGVPLVASNIFENVVKHKLSGYLVDPTDTREVADRVEMLINDKILRAKMGLGARKIAEGFDRKIVAMMYADVYSDAYDDAQRF